MAKYCYTYLKPFSSQIILKTKKKPARSLSHIWENFKIGWTSFYFILLWPRTDSYALLELIMTNFVFLSLYGKDRRVLRKSIFLRILKELGEVVKSSNISKFWKKWIFLTQKPWPREFILRIFCEKCAEYVSQNFVLEKWFQWTWTRTF